MDSFSIGHMLARIGAFFGAAALLYGLLVPCLGYMPDHQPYAGQGRASFLNHVHIFQGEANDFAASGSSTSPPEAAEHVPTAAGVQFAGHQGGMDRGTPTQCPAVLLPSDHLVLTQEALAIEVPGADWDASASHIPPPRQPPRI